MTRVAMSWGLIMMAFEAQNPGVTSFAVNTIGQRHQEGMTLQRRQPLVPLKVSMDWTSGDLASSSSLSAGAAAEMAEAESMEAKVSERLSSTQSGDEGEEVKVGSFVMEETGDGVAAPSVSGALEESSAPLTFRKFLTMQDKRVVVTVRFTDMSGFRPFFLTVAKKIQEAHPDVVMERDLVPLLESSSDSSKNNNDDLQFEVLVDGKVVNGKNRAKKHAVRGSSEDATGGRSVFVSMEEVHAAIAKARRRRRPGTLYADESQEGGRKNVGLDVLRSGTTTWTRRQASSNMAKTKAISQQHQSRSGGTRTDGDGSLRRKYGSKWS